MSRCRKILLAITVVLGVAVFILVVRHYQLRFAVESYIAELKAKGEPLELAQVLPPPVSPEHNGTDIFRQAAALFEADRSLLRTNTYYAMKMIAPGKAMVCWRLPDLRNYDVTNSWREVTAAVAQNEKSFALLQQLIEKPDFDFRFKYEQGFDGPNFANLHLTQSKRAAQRSVVAVLCDLHREDTASAVKDLRAMLALVKAMRNERLVIPELVRIAIANIAVAVNWEILQSPAVTGEQLAEVQKDWQGLDFPQSYQNALAMERVCGEITLAKWRDSSSKLKDYFDLGKKARESMGFCDQEPTRFQKAIMTAKIFMWRFWWSYADELRCLKGYEAMMESVKKAQTNAAFQPALTNQRAKLDALGISKLHDELESLFSGDNDFHSMLSQSIASLSRAFSRVMTIETVRQIVITATALKRYQIEHGNFPQKITDLTPKILSTVPLDPVDGQPLRYRLNADGTFLLYSIGENGKDDGGDPLLEKSATSSSFSWQNPGARDWVWPRPASPDEVQNFYAHPPK